MRLQHHCDSEKCLAQRERTKHAGPLGRRYETHVYCKSCGTYWDRDPERKGKRQNCYCCDSFCREGPFCGSKGPEKYAKRRAAKIARGEPVRMRRIKKSVEEDSNDLNIVVVVESYPITYPLNSQVMCKE
jgi:hypothetical protein